jgi:hypothetical protein
VYILGAIGASMTESDAHQMTISVITNYRKRSFETLVQEKNFTVPKKLRPRPKLPPKPVVVDVRPEESDETTQLQRLVLIEQLKIARLQQEYFLPSSRG